MNNAMEILTETDVKVPMRDGVRMAAHVFRPDAEGRFPGILLRTPYGRPKSGFERYVRAGYAVVSMDSRGRYGSEGDWVPFTEAHTGGRRRRLRFCGVAGRTALVQRQGRYSGSLL